MFKCIVFETPPEWFEIYKKTLTININQYKYLNNLYKCNINIILGKHPSVWHILYRSRYITIYCIELVLMYIRDYTRNKNEGYGYSSNVTPLWNVRSRVVSKNYLLEFVVRGFLVGRLPKGHVTHILDEVTGEGFIHSDRGVRERPTSNLRSLRLSRRNW